MLLLWAARAVSAVVKRAARRAGRASQQRSVLSLLERRHWHDGDDPRDRPCGVRDGWVKCPVIHERTILRYHSTARKLEKVLD
jgi:hypothetical protein